MRVAIARSSPGISAIFSSSAASPSALLAPAFAVFASLANSRIAARSSAVIRPFLARPP